MVLVMTSCDEDIDDSLLKARRDVGNALIGQNAPAALRGAVLGNFALCGAFGILVSTSLGGRLFDLWMPGGPFVQMGVINALVLAGALYVRFRSKN